MNFFSKFYPRDPAARKLEDPGIAGSSKLKDPSTAGSSKPGDPGTAGSSKSARRQAWAIPVNAHDRCNYFARHGVSNYQIQTVVTFDGRLDFETLQRAVRLTVDMEPVLGCRFEVGDPPVWKRMANLDDLPFCTLEVTGDQALAVKKFIEGRMDMDKDPMLKVRLIRSDRNDTLCIKHNHAACDGRGVMEYIRLLSEVYTAAADEGSIIPTPRIAGRKDQDRLVKAIGIRNLLTGFNPRKLSPRTMWPFPWRQGLPGSDAVRFVIEGLPQGKLDEMSVYAKARGATINDLILAAYYRAMFKTSQPLYGIPLDIGLTIDLRRYLPDQKATAIRNFSGAFYTRIPRVRHESFEGTLSRVAHATGKIKKGNPGLQNFWGGELVENMSFTMLDFWFRSLSRKKTARYGPTAAVNVCGPVLSNLGIISAQPMKFGGNTVTKAYILPPVVREPGMLLMASTYNGVLTLTIGFYRDALSRGDAQKFLRLIKDELMEGCI